MADEATINAAIQTIQDILGRYMPAYQSGQDGQLVAGQLPQGLYEHIENMSFLLSRIDPVTRQLNAQNLRIDDAYDPALASALQEFSTSPAFEEFSQAVSDGDQAAIAALSRQYDLPAFFEQNPQNFINFIENDLSDFITAMNALEENEHLFAPPVSEEQRQLQVETLPVMEEFLKNEYAFHLNSIDGARQNIVDFLEENTDEAERIAAQANLDTLNETLETLNKGAEFLGNADFDNFADDENARQALSSYVYFLQRHSPITDATERSGEYSQGFEEYIATLLAAREQRIEVLETNSDRNAAEEFDYQNLTRLSIFQGLMNDMVESGLYRQTVGDPNAGAPDLTQARSIIGEAINTMVRGNYVEVTPAEGAIENGEFDMPSRMALQAFIIDLKYFTGYDGDRSSGVYNTEFAQHLMVALNDVALRQEIADRYLRGDMAAAENLKAALDVYSNPENIPDLPNMPSNIAQNNLISKPELKAVEADVLQSVIARTPEAEMAGVNALVTTLSGYGLEDIMFLSDDPVESGRLARIMENAGQSRADALGELFEIVYEEAQAALEREDRPESELQEEISQRMSERLDDFTAATAAFPGGRIHALQRQIDNAVGVALRARENASGDDAQRFDVAREVFGMSVPSPERFLTENGPHTQGSAIFNLRSMTGVMPPVLEGFGGQIDKAPATLADLDGRGLQSIDAMIAAIESGSEEMPLSPIAQQTMQGVRDGLEENRALLEDIYNDAAEKGPGGELVVTDRHGESILLRAGENGLQVIYLDAQGIDTISDVPQISVSEEFGYDGLMIEAAMAGFQAQNQNIEHVRNYAPEFFEVAGQHYVVGVDRETAMVQIHKLDPEFLNATNSAQLNYATGPNARADVFESFMDNDAYRFIRENYSSVYSPAGSPDRIFQTMLQEMQGGDGAAAIEAGRALVLFGQRRQFDPVQDIPVTQLPRSEDVAVIDDARAVSVGRPEDVQTEAFLYLRQDEDSGQILLTVPALKDETTGEPPNEVTTRVFDPEGEPVVFDVSDPDVFMRMRDRLVQWDAEGISLRLDAVPPEMLNDPQFANFRSWLETGARPPDRPVEEPEPTSPVPELSEAGLNEMYESAAGFSEAGGVITLGAVIADMESVHAVLGYDPAAQFARSVNGSGAGVAIVHGAETGVWNAEGNAHEFFDDHVLVTFEAEGEVRAIAMSKDDFLHNPMRIPALLDAAYPGDTPPTVLMADRDRATLGAQEGLNVPATDLWDTVLEHLHRYNETPERVPDDRGQVLQPGRPLFWPRDGVLHKQRLEEEDHSALPVSEQEAVPPPQDFASLFAENCNEITCMAGMGEGANGGPAMEQAARLGVPRA